MDNKKWYVIHTYSGYENRVKNTLEERVRAFNMEDRFGQVLVPTEKVVEHVKGERRTSNRKFFPGYILVQMELNDETWHIVKNTPKVTGFIGGRDTPSVIPDEEVDKILQQMAEGAVKPKFSFEKGDHVRVVEGPFQNFNGIVDEVRPEKAKLKVLVSIFGRATPVELEFFQVTKE